MKIWGFKRKADAENSASISRQRYPRQWTAIDKRVEGRGWIGKVDSNGIAAMTGGIPGSAEVELYYVNVPGGGSLTALRDPGGPLAPISRITVYNVGVEDVPGNSYVPIWQLNGTPCVGTSVGEQATSTLPRIMYRIDSQDSPPTSDGIWNATAILVEGGQAPDPANPGQWIVVGDTFQVHDPHNQFPWPTLHSQLPSAAIAADLTGSIGWAYLRTDLNSNSNPGGARWEIESQSLPVERMRVYIKECLKHPNQGGGGPFTAYFNATDFEKQSSWPHVDFPNEGVASVEPGFDFELPFYNPLELTAVDDSYIWIEFDDGSLFSRASLDTPHNSGTVLGENRWSVTSVEKPIARWSQVEKQGAAWIPNSVVREGYDVNGPSAVCPTADYNQDTCAPDGTVAWAFYSPEDHQYIPVSTESALLGSGTDVQIVNAVNFSGCDLTIDYRVARVFCAQSPNQVTISPQLKAITVVRGIYASGSQICAATGVVYVCDAGNSADEYCIDICPLLCECPEFYSLPDTCEPPPCYESPCCYTWDGETWNLTTPCPEGCECAEPPNRDGEFTGEEICTQCREIPPPEQCCETWSGDEVVASDFILTWGDYQATPQPGQEVKPVSNGECNVSFSYPVDLLDNLSAESTTGTLTAVLRQEITRDTVACDPPCVWEVDIVSDNPAIVPNVSYEAAGQCKIIDPAEPWNCNAVNVEAVDGTITISDPDASVDDACKVPNNPAALHGMATAREPAGIGSRFIEANPEWFKGCGNCREGVRATMNRWQVGSVSDQQINNVARTIHNKNRTVDLMTVQLAIREFIK
jgi:hypothetical protein